MTLRDKAPGLVAALVMSGPVRRMSWRQRAAVVVFVFPVLTLLATLLFALEGAVYVLRSQPVEATVVLVYERPGTTIFDRGSTNYEPVFTYVEDGEARRASVGSGHTGFAMEEGDTALIRVIPGARGNVRLDTWQGLWFVPVLLGLIGLGSLAVAGVVWLGVERLFFGKGRT